MPKLHPPVALAAVVLAAFSLPLFAQTSASRPASLPELNWHLTARPWQPLNSTRTNLLDKVEDIINALAPLQYWNTAAPGDVQDGGDVQNGAIIDPYELREWQYATPYFSFAVATAVASGRSTHLCETGARALDHATADIAGLDGSAQANDSHGEFFAPPMMKALRLFKQIAPLYPSILTSNRIARWESRLTTSRVSYMNNGVGQNWRTYAMKGEWLRVQDGLVPRTGGAGGQGVDWIEDRWLHEQRARYVRDRDTFGLNPYFLTYHDDDPGPKQNFSYMGGATGNLLDMIYNGYDGPSRGEIEQVTRFCARSCLLFMSGNGDAPAAGRTGNHVWNDIVYGNTFELAAEMAWADGDARLAGQYRRAARLAFESAWRFQHEHGWFAVTKSLIHPSHQNFYATWSALCNYNGYTEIHSAEAFATELSPIPEQPAPAEIGGYVATLDEQFDNTFVNAGGMQLQICTEGSVAANVTGGLRWYAPGILRFSRPGWESRLGPGDGFIAADGSQAISFAPAFYESNAWQMVAQQPDRFAGVFTSSFVHPLLIRGTLNIAPKSGQTGPSFALNLVVTPDGVLVDTARTAGTNSFGQTWPLLIYDGKHVLTTNFTTHIASTAYPKTPGTPTVIQSETAALSGGVTLATSQTNYHGTGYAAFPASGGTVQWAAVDGGDGGAAAIGFRYALSQSTAAARTATLFVNGQPQTLTFEHTGVDSTYGGTVLSFPIVWHQLHVPVALAPGAANVIQLQAGTAGGLNIDELRVYPADAAQPEPDTQNFIALDAAPSLDTATPARRTAYGDQLPVRVTRDGNPVATFVYPRTADDPEAEAVRTSFVRSGTNFSSVLGWVTNNLYVGRTAAGGEGSAIDLDGDGTDDVSFSQNCGFVLQTSNALVTAMESDAFVTATHAARQVLLAPYTPITWSDTGTLWNNLPLAVSGRHFEVAVNYTPSATNLQTLLGYSGRGVTAAADLVAGLRFDADGRVTPVTGEGLVELFYEAGVVCHIRAEFDLITHQYSLWVQPGSGAEVQLVANGTLPAAVAGPADLDTFGFFADPATVSAPIVTALPELSVMIVSPAASSVTLAGTNVLLRLVGAITNAGPVATTWTKASGPGAVTFADSNAPATTARFGAEGIYDVAFAAGGTSASTNLTVIVLNLGPGLTNGLSAWWNMDELGGSLAADSSGNGRDATVVNGSFVAGYVSNALQLTTSSSRATYSAADGDQVTVAAWVRCDTTGGGSFPRVINAPGWRLMFRFSSSDPYSVGFATQDGVNGDWDSGGGSISLGAWYHVAATYDRGNLAVNVPVFYVNGIRHPTLTLAMPSGAAAPMSGTGYIGNNSALARAWNGLIDDLRVYDRVLGDGEVLALAVAPTANIAPEVFAGTNQTAFWPALVTLSGSASDDGNPAPPELTTTWTQASGPGMTTFGDTNALVTTAAFSGPGSYVLHLAANDGEVESVAQVQIDVLAVPAIQVERLAGMVHLSWATNGGVWRLQAQTNTGLSTNWVDVPGSETTGEMNYVIDPARPAVFFRLKLQ